MKKFRTEDSRRQITFLPKSIDEYVSAEDGVRYVDSFVDELDLSEIENSYKGGGRPAYNPKTLVKILVYGTIRGIRSSRELATACKENLRFIFLANNEKPDFRTISDFRKKFLESLGNLLKQTVRIGIEEGFITLEQVTTDGSKFRADADRRSFRSREQLFKLLSALEDELKEGIDVDDAEDRKYSGKDSDLRLPEGLEDKQKLRDKIKTALLTANENKSEISTTDPEAGFMKGQEGTLPSYNAQLSVDAESSMVVAAYVTDSATDSRELLNNVEEVEKTTSSTPKEVIADKGYATREEIESVSEKGVEVNVPLKEPESGRFSLQDFQYDEENDEYICPAGRVLEFRHEITKTKEDVYKATDCSGCPLQSVCLKEGSTYRTLRVVEEKEAIFQLKKRMENKESWNNKMAIRAKTIEIQFAWIKANRKLRRFFFRGLNNVNNLWKFEATVSNVVRLLALRRQKGG